MSSHYKSDGSPGIPLTWCRILVSGGSLVHPAPLPAGGEIAQREAVSPCGSGRSGPISEVCLQLRAECSGRLEGPLIFFLFDLKSWNYMQGEWKQNKLLIVGFGFVKVWSEIPNWPFRLFKPTDDTLGPCGGVL
uniref:Uncharacterized protein n=1 Tax=Bursaphelenchus xylophilus TaxID=6326 RepID=A0A1I7RU18_BURXY